MNSSARRPRIRSLRNSTGFSRTSNQTCHQIEAVEVLSWNLHLSETRMPTEEFLEGAAFQANVSLGLAKWLHTVESICRATFYTQSF